MPDCWPAEVRIAIIEFINDDPARAQSYAESWGCGPGRYIRRCRDARQSPNRRRVLLAPLQVDTVWHGFARKTKRVGHRSSVKSIGRGRKMRLFSIVVALLFTTAAYADYPGANVHDCSGVITAAGQPQNAFSASKTLRGFEIENVNKSDVICFSLTAPAALTSNGLCAQGSFTLQPSGNDVTPKAYTTPANLSPNAALSVISGKAGAIYSCQWW
jgi:hypothetical protein